jgi:hypothetical protein
MTVHRRFLPDRFRPRAPRRRSRRRFVLPAVVLTCGLLLLPLWTLQRVEIRGGEVVPESVTTSLNGLVGYVVPLLDLAWLHQVAATWPAAAEVRVQLELPGTLIVEIFPETICGSVPIGRRWHAVAADGRLAGALSGPRPPELVGFRRPPDRRLAFAVARRLAVESGAEVTAIELVTPEDYRVSLSFGRQGETAEIHVVPEGTPAEEAWCALVMDEGLKVDWADLRWPHRLVMREVG